MLVVAGVIIVASLAPLPVMPDASDTDKLGHFAAYFLLALLASGIVSPDRLPLAMLRCFLLGVGLEVLQAIATEYRLAEWKDLLANSAGILLAWLIAADGRAGWGPRAAARVLRFDKG